MRSHFIATMLFAVASTGTASARPMTALEKKAVENAVRDSLKDPDSARFKHPNVDVPPGGGPVNYCGVVNSKNSYGGYTGFVPFAASFQTKMMAGKPVTEALIAGVGTADDSDTETQAIAQVCEKYPHLG